VGTYPTVVDALTVAVLAFVGYRIFGGTRLLRRRDVRDHVLEIVRGLRLRHFLLVWPVLFLVLLVASGLILIPGLSWGWWTAIGGVGNPVVGATTATKGSPLEWIIPTVFIVMLIPALPLFAESEERMFRLGAEHRSTLGRIRRAIEFGLVHALIGIPIGVALALSIGGGYFTWAYLRGGIPESTRAHLAYNLTIVVFVAIAILTTGV
jgi:hypothetical protein